KIYRIWKKPSDRLRALLWESLLRIRPNSEYLHERHVRTFRTVHALLPTTFELKRGEAIGIVGRNGAGKSTLLQMVTGSLNPSGGTVIRPGKIAALLELGSGFDPESIGLQNVRINGMLLGLSRDDVE